MMTPTCSICQADTVIGVNTLGYCTAHVAEAVTAALTLAQAIRISCGLPPIQVEDIILIEELNDET